MKKLSLKNSSKRRNIVIITITLLILVGSFLYVAYLNKSWPFSTTAVTTSVLENNSDSEINYDPPTREDVDNSQSAKKKLIDPVKENSSANPSTVQVGISFADVVNSNVEIRAFVPGVIERDGVCTIVLEQSGQSVSKSAQAFTDATASQCRPIYVPLSELPTKGSWQLTVSYVSKLHQGKSEIIKVEVQ